MRYAGAKGIPVTSRSSGIGFYGAGIPSLGGIVLDLRRMNRILEVDAPDRKVKVEPGVTWPQVQAELAKVGMRVSAPLLPHPLKSVVTSCMEREPILISKSEYNDTLLTTQMVMPDGELLWTGTALGRGMKSQAFGEGMLPSSTRLFVGAQGSFSIITQFCSRL